MPIVCSGDGLIIRNEGKGNILGTFLNGDTI